MKPEDVVAGGFDNQGSVAQRKSNSLVKSRLGVRLPSDPSGIFSTEDFLDILKMRYSGEVSSVKYQSWIEAIELTSQRLKAEVEKIINEEYKLDPQGFYYRLKKRLFGK